MSAPYCQADGCHSNATFYYGHGGMNWSSNCPEWAKNGLPGPVIWSPNWFGGSRRLCRIHARHEFGVSIGGAA